MDYGRQNKPKSSTFLDQIKTATCCVFVNLLKDRKVSQLSAIILMFIAFLQIYSTLFVQSSNIKWDDDLASGFMFELGVLTQLIPYCARQRTYTLYWLIYGCSLLEIFGIAAIFIYLIYCSAAKVKYSTFFSKLLQTNILYFFWAFFIPIIECLAYIFRCNSAGKHIIDNNLVCYSSAHIVLICLSVISIMLAIGIGCATVLLYTRIEYCIEDSFAQSQERFGLEFFAFRTAIAVLFVFDSNMYGIFIIRLFITVFSSIGLSYQYIKYVPYYDESTSIMFGFECLFLSWVTLNALLTYVSPLSGHFVVILFGIYPVYMLARNIRFNHTVSILSIHPSKTKSENEANLQCHAIYALTHGNIDEKKESNLLGLINLHKRECDNEDCPLLRPKELYDPRTNKFANNIDESNLHKNQIFLKHFTKYYFETALSNHGNFPGIRIAYASFLFYSLRNIHLALTELIIAKKNKPNLTQLIEIYKLEQRIEDDLLAETERTVEVYYNLHLVTEFERIFKDCLNTIYQTCEAQIAFWAYIQHSNTIDFNVLNKSGEKIYKNAQEAENLWNQLSAIHPNHPQAKHKYAIYQREIRNNEKLASELQENLKEDTQNKVLAAILKSNDVIFGEYSSVIHVSGSKESAGRILKINKGTITVFGYSQQELANNSVNKLMPGIFARRHNDLMETHFKTGKSKVLGKERSLFGQHKDGFCIPLKLLVKQIPQLDNGLIHYVGLIVPIKNGQEYIITDMRGTISCLTDNLARLFKIEHKWICQGQGLNIVMICPELLEVFYSDDSQVLEKNSVKYKEIGGVDVSFLTPRNLGNIVVGIGGTSKKRPSKGESVFGFHLEKYNSLLNRKKGAGKSKSMITTNDIISLSEYRNSVSRKRAKCRMLDLVFHIGQEKDNLKVRVIEISSIRAENKSSIGNEEEMMIANKGFTQEDFEILSQGEDEAIADKQKVYNALIQNFGRPQNAKDAVAAKKQEEKEVQQAKLKQTSDESLLPLPPVETKKEEAEEEKKEENPWVEKKAENNDRKKSECSNENEENFNEEAEIKIGNYASDYGEASSRGARIRKTIISLATEQSQESNAPQLIPIAQAPPVAISPEPRTSLQNLHIPTIKSKFAMLAEENKEEQKKEEETKEEEKKLDVLNIKLNLLDEPSKENVNKQQDLLASVLGGMASESGSDSAEPSPPSQLELKSGFAFKKGESNYTINLDAGKDKDELKEENKGGSPITLQIDPSIQGSKIENFEGDQPKPSEHELNKDENTEDKEGALSIYPSIMGLEQDVAVKVRRPRILDHPMFTATGEVEVDEYEVSEGEAEIRKHLYEYQHKDKKVKDRNKQDVTEEAKNPEAEEEKNLLEGNEEGTEEKKEKEEEVQSIASVDSNSKAATLRAHYSIRSAIDEKYVPSLIKRLNYMIIGLIVLLLGISIIFFIYQHQLYSNNLENIAELTYSEQRKGLLIDVNLKLKELLILTSKFNGVTYSIDIGGTLIDRNATIQMLQGALKSLAMQLEDTQTQLSLRTSSLSQAELEKINPSNVLLRYKQISSLVPSSYNNTVWQAIMEIVVGAYRIANATMDSLNENDTSVYLLSTNSLNSVYIALQKSTMGIMSQINSRKDEVSTLLFILLLVASGAIITSTAILLPTINKVRCSQSIVLSLFTELSYGDIKEYMGKCDKFKKANMQKSEHEEEDKVALEESVAELVGEKDTKEAKEPKSQKDLLSVMANSNAAKEVTHGGTLNKGAVMKLIKEKAQLATIIKEDKKYKFIASNVFSFAIKFLFIIGIFEGYFVMIYFFSFNFLNKVSHLVDEFNLLLSRAPTHNFLMVMQKEIFLYNASTQIELIPAQDYVANFHNKMYDQEEQLLDIFAKNRGYHTEAYNKLFTNIVFSNLCMYNISVVFTGLASIYLGCEVIEQGILKQGLYASVIKYWDYLRQINSDFFTSKRTINDMIYFLNDNNVATAEVLEINYFSKALNMLETQLDNDINQFFSIELYNVTVLFAIFVVLEAFMYGIIWKIFLQKILNDQWQIKSLLAIISPKKILASPALREYILANSSATFINSSNHK